MRYRNRLTLYDFVCVFPWWVNAGLAVVTYFGMTYAHLYVGENRGLQLAAAGMPALAPIVAGFFVIMSVCSLLRQIFFGKKKVGERSGRRTERPRGFDEPSAPRRVELAVSDEAEPLCPFCGHTMRLRTAKRGANAGNRFWGCSRFPECTGTRKA